MDLHDGGCAVAEGKEGPPIGDELGAGLWSAGMGSASCVDGLHVSGAGDGTRAGTRATAESSDGAEGVLRLAAAL